MLHPLGPRHVGDVNQAVDARLDLHERAERGQVAHLPLDPHADGILLRQRHPGVFLGLLHAERDLLFRLVDLQYHRFDRLADRHDLRWVAHVTRPAHLGDVDQALDPRLELDERAVVRDRDDLALHARAHRVLRGHVLPGVRLQLLQAEADALALPVDVEDLDLHLLPDVHHLGRVRHAAIAHVRDVEQSVHAAQIDEGAEVGDVLDDALPHLAGVDGLLHITDMSYGRVSHPSEMVQIGQELEVKVLDIDWERERISLGLKQLQPYPWQNVAAKYPVGTRVQGKVVSITNYGAFVELEPGIEGLVHISEMSWTRNVRHPSKLVSIGESIEAVVLKVDETEEKVSLGMKQTEQDPWMALPQKYPVGTRLRGKVRNLTSFGAFVEIEPGIDGLIHISDMSWTKRVQHPSEVVKKGDEVDVLILNVDAENKRISLGLKQAQEDPWLRIGETYPVGTELRGRVMRLMDKGVVVDLGSDIEGFVPMSQLGIPDIQNPGDAVKEGQAVELKVLEVDPIHHRIVLAATGWPKEDSVQETGTQDPQTLDA